MDIRQNPLWLSFPLGRLLRTDVRMSVWFPLLALVLCLRLGLELGLSVTLLLLISIVFHEFAHVLVARRTGGSGHEILLWPLGGLAFTSPAPRFFSEFWTSAAGPISNMILCLACLPAVLGAGKLGESVSLLYLPTVDLAANPGRALLLLMFSLNFKLTVLNLLPIHPLDGSQMAFSVAKLFWDRQTARLGVLWTGMILCLLLLMACLFAQSVELVLLGSLLFMISMHEHWMAQVARQFDDSFMGYDFSQGYTSLEGEPSTVAAPGPGPFERWRRQRAEKKREKDLLQKLQTERRVDELLEKVHQQGMNSLTEAERRFLQRASSRYRSSEQE